MHAGVSGHLLTVNSKDEDLATRRLAGYGNYWIGLTDETQLGGTETGADPFIAKWGGWRGDPNEIPLNVRGLVAPEGWVSPNGGPYNYQAWGNGEPNNYGAGEDATVKYGTVWFDVPFNFSYSYIIEYPTGSTTPDPNAVQLPPLFPATPLPGIDGGAGFAGIQVFRNNPAIPNVEAVIQLIRSGELQNPSLGTALKIHFDDPGFGGGGLFPTGRQPFPGNLAGDDNNFQALIKGAFRVPEGQGGLWTFGVHSDDGFAFRIHGAQFDSAHGMGFIDFTDRATLTHPEPTADSDTRGIVDLPPGDYPFTFVFSELSGGAFCELYAAPGSHASDSSTTQWRLVGAPDSPLQFVAPPLPPTIVEQPASRSEPLSGSATFSVEAAGAPPISFQWHFNGVPISGATSHLYTIDSVQASHAGTYTVVVRNAAGPTTSAPAVLAIRPRIGGIHLRRELPGSSSSLALTWRGGRGPFVVRGKSDLSAATWTDVMTTDNPAIEFDSAGDLRFFQVLALGTAPIAADPLRVSYSGNCNGEDYFIELDPERVRNGGPRNDGQCPWRLVFKDANDVELAVTDPVQPGNTLSYDTPVGTKRVYFRCDNASNAPDCILSLVANP